MSRRPINVEVRGLKTPRERVWEAVLMLADAGDKMTRETVQDCCDPMVPFTAVVDYTDDLLTAGYLKRVPGSGGKKGVLQTQLEFTLAKRQHEAPRLSRKGAKVTQGSGTEAMWRAMKVLPSFDYHDIARAATLGDLVVKPATAKHYVVHLARAGYLATLRAAKPGTPAKHRLSNNTGPHAPAITRMRVVFDRNTGGFANLQTPQEVCDGLE